MGRSLAWSKKEMSVLIEQYPLEKKEVICQNIPQRKWIDIVYKAHKLKIKREYDSRILHKIDNLLQETHEAYYWMGFIAADGNFGEDKRHGSRTFSISLAIKDLEHLKKLAMFIEANICEWKNGLACGIHAGGQNIESVMDKFDLRERKTYNPPKTIKWMKPELALSFLIGFIDGDGHITDKTMAIRIRNYYTWLDILKEFNILIIDTLHKNNPVPYIDNTGYASFGIYKNKLTQGLKAHAINNKLPILARKWDRVNLIHN